MNAMTRLATILLFTMTAACVEQLPDDGGGGVGGGGFGGGGGGGGEGGQLTATEYLDALGKTECDEAFACKASFPTSEGPFEDAFGATVAVCYEDAAEYYDVAKVEAAIAAGKLTFDGAAAKACIEGIAAPNCATYWTEGPSSPDACDDVMVGKVADGAACTIDFECANLDAFCDETTAKCTVAPEEMTAMAGRRASY